MADIFISYAKTDRIHAERLAAALEDQGWSVWWDPEIPAGKTFDDVIEQAIEAAKSILVIWSKHSVNSRWVRTEAAEGADRGILVPAQIEDTPIPLAFKRIQAANLIEWDGTKSHLAFKKLVRDITGILGPSPTAVAEEQRKAAEQAQRLKAKEQAAKREADLDAKRKADKEKAKQAEERRLAEQEAQLKAEEAQKSEEEDAKRKAKEAPPSRIVEPDHPTVPPTSLRSPLTKIAVLGGIIVVAILTAVIISREHESVREQSEQLVAAEGSEGYAADTADNKPPDDTPPDTADTVVAQNTAIEPQKGETENAQLTVRRRALEPRFGTAILGESHFE